MAAMTGYQEDTAVDDEDDEAAGTGLEDWEEDVRLTCQRQQEFSHKLEFGLKLGYSESQVEAAVAKLGLASDQNTLLAELIALSSSCKSSGEQVAASAACPTRGHQPLHHYHSVPCASGSAAASAACCQQPPQHCGALPYHHHTHHHRHASPSSSASSSSGGHHLLQHHHHQSLSRQSSGPFPHHHHPTLNHHNSHNHNQGQAHHQHPQLHSFSSSPPSLQLAASSTCSNAGLQQQQLRPIVVDGSNVAMT